MQALLLKYFRRIDQLQQAKWFKVVASILLVGTIASLVTWILTSRPDSVPMFLSANRSGSLWLVAALAVVWSLLVVWLNLLLSFVLIGLGVGLFSWLILLLGSQDFAFAVLGFGLLTFTFLVLIRGFMALYQQPVQVLSIAQTLIKESIRSKVSVVFIVGLLIILPLIPLFLRGELALQYRIQSFIGYSMGTTFYLAALMTIFLACSTVSFEIRDRQIWQLMTKPVSRVSYLAGKWLGIVTVNFVLLVVTGVSIFVFVQYLRMQPANSQDDREAVENEVLVARLASFPEYDTVDQNVLLERVKREIEQDFSLKREIESGLRSRAAVESELASRIIQEHGLQQRTIGPGQKKTYTFSGLETAKDLDVPLRLRYQIHYGAESTHEQHPITFIFERNGQAITQPLTQHYVPTMSHFLTIPPQVIGDAGSVDLAVINGYVTNNGQPIPGPQTPMSLNFDEDDLELLFAVGSFEINYLRAMLVNWIKLAFLAVVGISAATILSFPVGILVTCTIFLAAIMGPFLQISLEYFTVSSWLRVDRLLIKAIAWLLVVLFEPFGSMNPTQRLVEGRLIPWIGVLRAFALLGVLWSGIAFVLGYLAFRERELATYSGRG